jgi:cytochrome oxidase assembly protein ShyY1
MEAPTHNADAPAHLSDEFPAGYSLTRCSPAELVSASPAGVDHASALVQVRGFFNNDRSRSEKPNHFHRQQATLTGRFFCPKNGETLRKPESSAENLKVQLDGERLRRRFELPRDNSNFQVTIQEFSGRLKSSAEKEKVPLENRNVQPNIQNASGKRSHQPEN